MGSRFGRERDSGRYRKPPAPKSSKGSGERNPPTLPPFNLRAVASSLLFDVLARRRNLKQCLQEEQVKLRKDEDRALLRELATGVVRRLPLLDRIIDEYAARGRQGTDPRILQVLRVGAYQILFLTKIPDYAAVDRCVEAAKAVLPGSEGFVNGLLRRVSEQGRETLEAFSGLPGTEGLALRTGMPEWIVDRYVKRFGADTAAALLEAQGTPPTMYLYFPDEEAEEAGVPALANEGVKLERDSLLNGFWAVVDGYPLETRTFRRGHFYVMDPAAAVPPLLLPLKGGEAVLDLCAAPGGKTVVLAGRLPKGWVLSTDLRPARLRLIRENVERLGIRNVRLARLDASHPLPFGEVFPAVLVDAPCSSLGTLRKNPEIRWQMRELELKEKADREAAILRQAADAVAPGGVLMYTVCSLEPEETEGVVQAFLDEHPDFTPEELALPEQLVPLLELVGPGRAYLLPHRHNWDGFYMALFRRKN